MDGSSGFLGRSVRWWGILQAGAAVAAACSVAGFLPRYVWRFEQLCHFRPQYFLFLAVCTVLFLLGNRRKSAVAAGVVAAINLAFILPLYVSGDSPRTDGPRVRILLANVHTSNTQHERVIGYIRASRADLVVLEEIDDRWLDALAPLDAFLPHRKKEERQDNFGLGVWSRLPFDEARTEYFGWAGVPSIVALVKANGVPLTLIATHPLPPTSGEAVALRNEQLAEISRFAAGRSGARIVVGDLNTTSWSPVFGELMDGAGLRDTRRGFGIQPTWPAGLPWLWVPIDHCLVSSDIAVLSREIGPSIGSDHYPVLVELALPQSR